MSVAITADTSITNASILHLQIATGASSNYVLTSDSSGNASWQPKASGTNSAVSVYLTNTQANVTGNGAIGTLVCDTVLFDINGYYNTGSGVFTAPTTGKYFINCNIYCTNISSAMNLSLAQIHTPSKSYNSYMNPVPVLDPNNQGYSFSISTFVNLSASDQITASLNLYNGSSNTANFLGMTPYSNPYSWFTCYRVV
jgi:hypothetical protein